jgi:hypothetical protein
MGQRIAMVQRITMGHWIILGQRRQTFLVSFLFVIALSLWGAPGGVVRAQGEGEGGSSLVGSFPAWDEPSSGAEQTNQPSSTLHNTPDAFSLSSSQGECSLCRFGEMMGDGFC